jgi:hypothetical protein
MASSVSKLDGHPQQDQVDRWLLAGKTVRWVAAQTDPPVSFGSIQRYKKNLLGPALRRVASKLSGLGTIPVTTVDGGQIVERPLREVTQEARLDGRVGPFWERHQAVWGKTWQAVLDSETAMKVHKTADGKVVFDGRDFAALNMSLNQAHKSLELLGRATALFDDQVSTVTQNTIVLVLPQAPAEANAGPAAMVLDVTGEK